MTALTQLGPRTWVCLDDVVMVELQHLDHETNPPRKLRHAGCVRAVVVDVILTTRHGHYARVRIPGTTERMTPAERYRLTEAWLSEHLGDRLGSIDLGDVPGACGEPDCPGPHS